MEVTLTAQDDTGSKVRRQHNIGTAEVDNHLFIERVLGVHNLEVVFICTCSHR